MHKIHIHIKEMIDLTEGEKILHTPIIKAAAKLIESCNFEGALECLNLISSNDEDLQAAKLLLQAYVRWDAFDYASAEQSIKKLQSDHKNTLLVKRLSDSLARQVEFLGKVINEHHHETPAGLISLYQNAQRRWLRGLYPDSLARSWRVIEGSLYYRLREMYGINPVRLADSSNQELAQKLHDELQLTFYNRLDIHRSKDALLVLGDSAWEAWEAMRITVPNLNADNPGEFVEREVSSCLDALRYRRNMSVISHGMRWVKQEEAKMALILAQSCIECIVGAQPDNYPLDAASAKLVKDALLESETVVTAS